MKNSSRLFFLLAWHQNFNESHGKQTWQCKKMANIVTLMYFQFEKKNTELEFHSCYIWYRVFFYKCKYSNQCTNPEFLTNSCSCPTNCNLVVWVGGLGFDSKGTREPPTIPCDKGIPGGHLAHPALGFPACHGKIPGLSPAVKLKGVTQEPRTFEEFTLIYRWNRYTFYTIGIRCVLLFT